MSVSSESKLKQAGVLAYFKTISNDKKRKLDDDTNCDEVKCRKLSIDSSKPLSSENQQHTVKKDSLHGKLQETDETAVMDVETIDLCEDADSEADENACPSANDSSLSINESLPPTPKTANHLSMESSKPSDGTNSEKNSSATDTEKVQLKKITPKKPKETMFMRKEDRDRLKQEKERLKQEKEKERLAKLEAKEEEKRQKEEERKAKEEEKRQKAQAKEEERKAKEEERKAKEEEKRQKAQAKEEERRQKEEERKAKEEEKRQKDEEKRLKDEEKRQREELEKKSKEKSAALFTNFFLKSKSAPSKSQSAESSVKVVNTKFMPFEVKDNMRLATVHRATLTPERLRYLDEILSQCSDMSIDSLYLARLRSKNYAPGHSENTEPFNVNDDDDEIKDETAAAPRYRCKLLQFRENRRPAYWGTWRKRSKTICGRRPFKLDTTYFEYDIDSDDEWVDEEPGESLGGSEDDLESEDDYEVDNDMFVPHGYLSDEEGQPDEVPEGSPKSHKQKLNILEKQFEAEMKEKTSKLKPRVYGCIWISNDVEKNGRDDIENMLLTYRAVWNENRAPFRVSHKVESSTPTRTPSSKSKTTPQTLPIGVLKEFPEALTADLIKLVHGNKLSGSRLVEEFKSYALSIDSTYNLTKSCLLNKIREIGVWVPGSACWMVNEDVRQQQNLSDLSPTDNTWKYVSGLEASTSKKSQNAAACGADKASPAAPTVTTPTSSGRKKKASSITKFIRVYKPSDKGKQPPSDPEKQPPEATAEKEETPLPPAPAESEK